MKYEMYNSDVDIYSEGVLAPDGRGIKKMIVLLLVAHHENQTKSSSSYKVTSKRNIYVLYTYLIFIQFVTFSKYTLVNISMYICLCFMIKLLVYQPAKQPGVCF